MDSRVEREKIDSHHQNARNEIIQSREETLVREPEVVEEFLKEIRVVEGGNANDTVIENELKLPNKYLSNDDIIQRSSPGWLKNILGI